MFDDSLADLAIVERSEIKQYKYETKLYVMYGLIEGAIDA